MRERVGRPLEREELELLFNPPRSSSSYLAIVGITVECYHCGHRWVYKGRSKIYVTCPQCLRKVNLRKIYSQP